MTQQERTGDFPRDEFLELLHAAKEMFATEQKQRNLYATLGLSTEGAERQATEKHALMPEDVGPAGKKAHRSFDVPERDRRSLASFATALLDHVSQPARMDAAITLARRAVREIGDDSSDRWSGMLRKLDQLQRVQRLTESDAPNLESYREWIDFECRHQYSLTDRFFGREEYLAMLDEWVSTDNDVWIRCICALGGGGKSALAWQWISKSLTSLRQNGFIGAFWCSFYEKNFNFDEFLRRALAFAGRIDEQKLPTARGDVERRLLEVVNEVPVVFVLDGLERLMNGYADVATRAVDLEGASANASQGEVSRSDRRMIDPRDGAFLQRLTEAATKSRFLITTRLVPADLERPGDDGVDLALPHVEFTDLPGLGREGATNLWASIAPNAEITDHLMATLFVSEFHPLVISILARAVNKAGGSWNDWLALEQHRDFDPRVAPTTAGKRSYIIGVCMRDLPDESYDILGVLTTTGKPMKLRELSDIVLLGSIASGDGRWTEEAQVSEQLRTLLGLGLIGEATPPDEETEYDVHPVVRGAVWNFLTDPRRERFLEHALSEVSATPDRRDIVDLGALDRTIGLFRLLVQSGQLDRAWEMFATKLWPPLARDSANNKLLKLFEELLPDREPLQLLPLEARRAQAQALEVLAGLFLQVGDGPVSDHLLRWCGALFLQIGDHVKFLDASHSRAWKTMYEGRLFETEFKLREMKLQSIGFGAYQLQPQIDCWIGIVLAMRGEREEARKFFDGARDRTFSQRWWSQGLAEGLVYLEEADQALRELPAPPEGPTSSENMGGAMQIAWEQLTEGMAHVQTGDHEKAMRALSEALRCARQADYRIIQCFALPYIAQIELEQDKVAEAEERAESYHDLDPRDAYALCASDAWRIRAECRIRQGDLEKAREYATNAYRLAACDGPPFVYQAGLRRALATLEHCGAYVPHTRATLDPGWSAALDDLQQHQEQINRAIAHAIYDARRRPSRQQSLEEALEMLDKGEVLRTASTEDRNWWNDLVGAQSTVNALLVREMEHSDISLAQFRRAFDASPQKSLAVVFRGLRAKQIIDSDEPRPVRDLSEEDLSDWLANGEAHEAAFEAFLQTDMARQMSVPFQVHHFGPVDVEAFLKDHKRRIQFDSEPFAMQWWEQLENRRHPAEMLVLAESVLRVPARLSDVVQEISVASDSGLAYAFEALHIRRAAKRFDERAISRAEGWSPIEILLRLQDVKFQFGWAEANQDAKEFWTRLEKNNERNMDRVLQLAEELARRDSSVAEYYEAYLASHTENIQANLAYLDYLRHREERWDGTQPWPRGGVAERWAYENMPPSFTDANELSENQVSGRLQILLRRVGLKEASEEQQDWWTTIEQRSSPEVMLRLAEELDERRADVKLLRNAMVDGATENIVAGLAYMDFSLLKRTEDQRAGERANEHNRLGNDHYVAGQYKEAIENYLEAIKEKPTPTYYTNLSGAWELVDDLTPAEALERSVRALQDGLEEFSDSKSLKDALHSARNKHRLLKLGGISPSAKVFRMLPVVTPIAVEVASNLIPLVEGEPKEENLLGRTPAVRDRVFQTTGIKVPGTRYRGNEVDLPDGTYIIMLDEVPLISGNVSPDRALTLAPEAKLRELEIKFEEGINPLDGTDAFWIAAEDAGRIEDPVWDATEYILRHLESVLVRNISTFAGLQEITGILENVWQPVAREIASEPGLVARLTRLIRALLDERVGIQEIEAILDVFMEQHNAEATMDALISATREIPAVRKNLPGNGPKVLLVEFDEEIETLLRNGLRPLGDEHVLALEPEPTQEILSAVRSKVENFSPARQQPTLLIRDELLRRYARKLVELEFPNLFTLSRDELLDLSRPVQATIGLD